MLENFADAAAGLLMALSASLILAILIGAICYYARRSSFPNGTQSTLLKSKQSAKRREEAVYSASAPNDLTPTPPTLPLISVEEDAKDPEINQASARDSEEVYVSISSADEF